jgi:hypothetical protein
MCPPVRRPIFLFSRLLERAFDEYSAVLPSHHPEIGGFCAVLLDVFIDSKLPQNPRRVGRNLDSGSDVSYLGHTFQYLDMMAGFGASDCCGQAGKAAANDNDMLLLISFYIRLWAGQTYHGSCFRRRKYVARCNIYSISLNLSPLCGKEWIRFQRFPEVSLNALQSPRQTK